MSNIQQLKHANLDHYQMDNATFDPDKSAWRVSVVDGVTLNVDQINMPENSYKSEPQVIHTVEIKEIRVPEIIKQVEIQQVSVPVIVPEIRLVEVPVIVPEVRVVEIEKPVIIKEVEIKTIEIPTMIIPTFIKACILIQAIVNTGLLVAYILKG